MAIDTAAKRFSLPMLAMPFGRLLPPPDATIDAADRRSLLRLYAGSLVAVVHVYATVRLFVGKRTVALSAGERTVRLAGKPRTATLEAD